MTRVSDKDTTSPIAWDLALSSSLCTLIVMWCNALRYFPKLIVESLVDVFGHSVSESGGWLLTIINAFTLMHLKLTT